MEEKQELMVAAQSEELFGAIKTGDLKRLKALLPTNLDIRCDEVNKEPIWWIASDRHQNLIEYLRKNLLPTQWQALWNKPSPSDISLLHVACIYGRLSIIKYAHDHLPIEQWQKLWFIKTDTNETALHMACSRDRMSIITYAHENLLKEQWEALWYIRNGYSKNTPLHEACRYGHLNTIAFAQKTLPDELWEKLWRAKNKHGYTPMDLATNRSALTHSELTRYEIVPLSPSQRYLSKQVKEIIMSKNTGNLPDDIAKLIVDEFVSPYEFSGVKFKENKEPSLLSRFNMFGTKKQHIEYKEEDENREEDQSKCLIM